MTPLPRGPWLVVAESIGPIQQVCTLSSRGIGAIGGFALLVIVGSPLVLLLMARATCAAVRADLDRGAEILCGFVLAWIILCMVTILCSAPFLRKRLIVGERGIAVWLPWRTVLVPFAELGTDWRCFVPSGSEYAPLSMVLEHTNGQRVEITAEFEDHHQVALRVLEEVHHRPLERETEPGPDGTDAIKPARHDISEPREESP